MNNFEHAIDASVDAQNSAGSAADENARYMESLDAKVSKLKSTFQQLSLSVVDSGLVKGMLDLATGFLQLANTDIGTFVTQVALLGSVMYGFSGLIKASNILPSLFGKIASSGGALSKIVGFLGKVVGLSAGKFLLIAAAIGAVIALAPSVIDCFKKMTDPVYDAESKLADYNEELKTNKERLEELQKIPEYRRTDEINDEIRALQEKNRELERSIELEEYNAKKARYEKKYGGTHGVEEFFIKKGSIDGFGDYVYEQTNSWTQASIATVQTAEQALEALVKNGRESSEAVSQAWEESGHSAKAALEALGYTLESHTKQISQEEYFTGLVKDIEDLNTAFFANNNVVDQDFINKYGELSKALKELQSESEGLTGFDVPEWAKEVIDKYESLIDITPELQDAFYDVNTTIGELNEGIEITSGQYEQLARQFPEIAEYLAESGDGWVVASEKIEDFKRAIGDTDQSIQDLTEGASINETQFAVLSSTYKKAADMLEENGGKYTLAADKVDAFIQAIVEANGVSEDSEGSMQRGADGVAGLSDANETAKTKANNATNAISKESDAVSGLASATEGASGRVISAQTRMSTVVTSESRARKTQLQSEYTLVENLIKKYNELKEARAGSGGLSGPRAVSYDASSMPRGISFFASEEQLDDQTKAFKEQIEIMEHRLFLMEKEGKSEEDRIVQIRAIQAELEKQKQWYYSQGLDANSEYIRDLEKQWWGFEDDIKDLYKDQADVYETLFSAVADKAKDEIEALKEKKDAIKAENEAIEEQIQKQEALDNLAKAKQQKVLAFKDGRMQYVSDVDAVSEAQKNLDEIGRKEEEDKRLEEIDKEIEKWEEMRDQWGSVAKEYKKFQDLLMLEQKLGIKLEGENWEQRLGNLQDYVDKYNELMSKANAVGKVENAVVTPFQPPSKYGPENVSSSSGIPLIKNNKVFPNHSSVANKPTFSGLPSSSPKLSNITSGLSQVVNIAIEKFSPVLPNVSDGEGFANYMKNNFWRETLHYVKA